MSGDATKTSQWSGADVYTAASGSAGPTDLTTAWPVAWSAVGLLDGEDGITESREDDKSDFYAWGGLLVKTVKSKHKRQIKFSMLEDNAVTFGLVNPGSTRTTTSGVNTSTIKVPVYPTIALGFEVSDGTKKKRRYSKSAVVDAVEDVKDQESGLTVYTVTATIYPESDGTLFREVSTA